MYRLTLAILLSLSMVSAVSAQTSPASCSAQSVQEDAQRSLIGNVEVSTLRVSWVTGSEGADLAHYEIWNRDRGTARRVGIIHPQWSCPRTVSHELLLPYDPRTVYYLEIHVRDETIRSIPIPIR